MLETSSLGKPGTDCSSHLNVSVYGIEQPVPSPEVSRLNIRWLIM